MTDELMVLVLCSTVRVMTPQLQLLVMTPQHRLVCTGDDTSAPAGVYG